jgi:hypothetical protein
VSVQKALAAAESQSREALALSEETEELEAAVCRASQRVAALHEALSGDEAALSARLAAQASRLKVGCAPVSPEVVFSAFLPPCPPPPTPSPAPRLPLCRGVPSSVCGLL